MFLFCVNVNNFNSLRLIFFIMSKMYIYVIINNRKVDHGGM